MLVYLSIAFVLGTRPEIIKMSPIIRECLKEGLDFFVLHTLLGGSIIGLSGAYLFYSPQLKDARIEIDYLSKKLELEATDEQTTASTGQDKAPDFTLIDLDGNIFTLSDKTGQIVLLDFMATWCGPCQAAMPDLVKLYEEFGDKVVMISISVDPSFDTDEVLSGWRDQWGASWIHARDLADPPWIHARDLADPPAG
jgi:thiol-disulfide isomerase/thioredoxin